MLCGMGFEDTELKSIAAVADDEVAHAIKLVFRKTPNPAQSTQIEAALYEIEHSPKANRILLWFRRGGMPRGAVWAQIRAGRVAALWPPGLLDPEEPEIATALVTAVLSRA